MKKTLLLFTVVLFAIKAVAAPPVGKSNIISPLQAPGISFTENKGQVHDQYNKPKPDVLYGVMAGNMAVHIKTHGVSYQLFRIDKYKNVVDKRTNKQKKVTDKQTIHRVDLSWLNCNNNISARTDAILPGYLNYYLENSGGSLNVKSFTGISLQNLYNGITLHYYEKNGELKHDYLVSAGADFKQIQIKAEGAEIRINTDGSLVFVTPLGNIEEGAPIVYQNGLRLNSKWKNNNNILSFDIQDYNPAYELIIDPVTRAWGTYYGGTAGDFGGSCASDPNGNVYIAGITEPTTGTVLATTGSHQTTYSGGNQDAFLAKFNSSGTRLWATYYGGNGYDMGFACTADATGNVYLAGETSTSTGTVIATPGSQQSAFGGGNSDAFLVKFNTNGLRQWGTYYGGSSDDSGYGCTTDGNGNVYLTGQSSSSTAIASSGAHQTVVNPGGAVSNNDAFLVKFTANGSRVWGTYYGAPGDDHGHSCVVDAIGDVYMAGGTSSTTSTLIATVGSHQTSYGGSAFSDAFLVKFNTVGVRQWGTFYGGAGADWAYSCVTDASGNVYIAGYTESSTGTVIATSGSHQSAHGGNEDAFLAKFNTNGIRQWGTYYGGSGDEEVGGCSIDAAGNIFIAGYTTTNAGTSISTAGGFQMVYGGGFQDGFLAKFNNNGTRQWGTYYGGAGDDGGYSCSVDASGNVYLAGTSDSNTGTVIATPGSHQPVFGGNNNADAFLVKFSECVTVNLMASGTSTFCSGATLSLNATVNGTANPTYNWIGPNTFAASTKSTNVTNAGVLSAGIYTVTSNNSGCIETATILVSNADPTITVNSGAICRGQSYTLVASGASTYTYSSGPVVTPTISTTYSVNGTNTAGCKGLALAHLTVNDCVSGLNETSESATGIKLFPNPVKNILNVELDSDREIIFLNAIGQKVYSLKLNAGKQTVNLEGLAKGVYVVKITSTNHSENFRVIKE